MMHQKNIIKRQVQTTLTEPLSEWGKHFQFREKLRSVTVFRREEKSGLNFSAAPSQLDHEEASKDFS